MKKGLLIITIALFTGFAGCKKVLDTKPGDAYSEADLFSNISLTEQLVDFNYNVLDQWGMDMREFWGRRVGTENASDESWFHFTPSLFNINTSVIDPDNQGLFTNLWNIYYSFIGKSNDFLSKIDAAPVSTTNPEKVAFLKGEMKFLRAYAYMKLINYYGGVPIIDKPFGLNDDFSRERDSYKACVAFIVKELDESAALIPSVTRMGTDFGRISKSACMGLKSRVLLYAASPLHDPGNTAAPRGPLYDYDVAAKWQNAADAAKAVMDLNAYALVAAPNAAAYQKLFLTPNNELILGRPYSPDFAVSASDFNTFPDKALGPVSNGGWGLSNPTHNFVQSFKMANGKRITEVGSGYDDANLYVGREMRFYANILYNGAIFKNKALDYWQPGGKDSKDIGPPNHFAATGYNLRKFMDESITVDLQQSPKRPYPLIRLAEIYLNYAEASYFAGNEAVARQYASLTAQRVGLPAITTTGTALLDDIKYERQMELFFEG
ncbi:MAG: RagB/SusD family nutrient uptake outer membrane protein, partial [Ferruginibacter sp.]